VTGFFAAYFQLLRHPIFPVTTMPMLAPDRLIGFSPLAIIPYVSLWIYAFLAPGLLRGWSELRTYAIGALVVGGAGLGLFLVWPTTIVRPHLDWQNYPGFSFLKTLDTAGNACPSLHVAFAVFSAIWLERLLREAGAPRWVRLLNCAWCATIAYSTLATKQHVTVDVLAGTALGLAGGMWHPREQESLPGGMHPFLNRRTLAVALSLVTKVLIPALNLWPGHRLVSLALFCGPDLWILSGLLIPNTTWLMPVVREFATTRREVWLTIDDGPEPATTRRMLDLLDQHKARATFFVIGEKVAAHPDLVAEIVRRGHSLGNHTQTHPVAAFWLAGPRRTRREVDDCDAALRSAGAAPSGWFRPPAGIRSLFLPPVLLGRQGVLVGWTGRGREQFSASPDRPLRRLKRKIRPGAILLTHESARHGEQRIVLLTLLLEHLAANGYRCVLPELKDLR